MDGELTEGKPFGSLNRRRNPVSGTNCSFECVCPGSNCKYIAVHVTKDVMKTSVAQICEVFFIRPEGVSIALGMAIDRIAENGGSKLDSLLQQVYANLTIAADTSKKLESTVSKEEVAAVIKQATAKTEIIETFVVQETETVVKQVAKAA